MSKLPKVGATIFSVMTQMANEHKAINLAQGFPNFPVDERLSKFMDVGANSPLHQYAPMGGSPKLIEEIVRLNEEKYGTRFAGGEEILVTAGAAQAIFTAIQALIYPGDEVIMLDPAYDCYDPAVALVGAKGIHINLNDEFKPDWEAVNSSVHSNTKMIIINNPHNPAGTLWTKEDFDNLTALTRKFPQLLVLSDEVYEYITFEQEFISAKQKEELRERLIAVSSFGKTFHITGWKIGYLTAPKNLMIEIKKVHQFLVFSVNHISQNAIAEYAKIADFNEIARLYQRKRDLFANEMKSSRFKLFPCEGSFFQLASYKGISEERDTEFVKTLVKKCGVATIPVSVFNANGKDQKVIRFCFAKDDKTLINASKQLCQI